MATKKKTEGEHEGDIFLVILSAPEKEPLIQLLKEFPMDAGELHVNPRTKKAEVHLFVDGRQIDYLKKHGWKFEILENMSEVGRARQKEVGKGDRFEGGKIPPKGLGKKL